MRVLPAIVATSVLLLLVPATTAESDPPPCPAVTAKLMEDGSVVLRWDTVAGADGYNVFGPREEGPLLFRGHTEETEHVDQEVAAGRAAVYQVTATQGELQSVDCPTVEATPIPFFPSGLAAALAAAAAVTVFVLARPRT